ncbi:hypothetical protein OIDMADRAFT_26084 [Oidiodendron maius Zn]|uniref:Uncharacterized protein n=1 Tax=Oidiodendron maius (strain Zn) TaxID=913774 RepID=A0A0C3HJV7_OIDMZ|nr:hypothetical protein OIDMADRAFT_26084 [Oidiodendron maius Zn]
MSGNDILIDIFNALRRLETRIASQGSRLSAIDHSNCSAPFTPEGSFVHSAVHGFSEDKQLSEFSQVLTPPPSSPAESPISLYEASILKLRRRFEFMDDSCSNVHDTSGESSGEYIAGDKLILPPSDADRPNGWVFRTEPSVEGGTLYRDNDDVYSQSIYSSRPLSRAEPPISRIPLAPHIDRLQQGSQEYDDGLETHTAVLGNTISIAPQVSHTHNEVLPVTPLMRNKSQKSSTGSSRSSRSSCMSQQPNWRVEMAYCASDIFVESLRSSWPFHSKERRDEARRLKRLVSPVAEDSTMSASILPPQGKGKWTPTLRGLLLQPFSKARLHHSGRISFVS